MADLNVGEPFGTTSSVDLKLLSGSDIFIKDEDDHDQPNLRLKSPSLNHVTLASALNGTTSASNEQQMLDSTVIDISEITDFVLDPSQELNIANMEIVHSGDGVNGPVYTSDEYSPLKTRSMISNISEDMTTDDLMLGGHSCKSEKDQLAIDLKLERDDTSPTVLSDYQKNQLHFVKYVDRDGKSVKIWECGVCGKEFGHQYTLMRHLPTHTDERKFQCNTCGKAFRQMSTLSQHRAIHSAERPYVCELCRKTFNRVSTLISHRKTHSGLKPHQCHLCHKAFHQKGNLRNHIFTHTNERPYKCDVCQKGFNQMSNLMCHKLKAHQRSDKPKYVCRICGSEFPKRVALRNHEEYKHGIRQTVPQTPTASGLPLHSHLVAPNDGEKMHIIHIPDLNPGQPLNGAPLAPNGTRVRYTNGVLVDAIQTTAMKQAQQAQQQSTINGQPSAAPFALLRPIGGIPVLVRVLSAPHGKHMLVPATAEDLRTHGKVTITENALEAANEEKKMIDSENKENINPILNGDGMKGVNGSRKRKNSATSTVQIKIPVVATVVQKINSDGTMSMSVESPGPDNKQIIQDPIMDHLATPNNPVQFLNDCQLISTQSGGMRIEYPNNNQFNIIGTNFDQKLGECDNSIQNHTVTLAQNISDGSIYSENIQITNIDNSSVYEIVDDHKQNGHTNFTQDIILDDQNLYTDVNSLTLYSQSQNDFTILQ